MPALRMLVILLCQVHATFCRAVALHIALAGLASVSVVASVLCRRGGIVVALVNSRCALDSSPDEG